MKERSMPDFFSWLLTESYIKESDIMHSSDGFFLVYKSLSDILAIAGILDFPDSDGVICACNRFFDDWFLYAVPNEEKDTYSLLKLREQEHDVQDESPADGDTPGVTVSFISFQCEKLLHCLQNPIDANRKELGREINRVVAYKGQRHHKALKRYFANPESVASYIVASVYMKHVATFATNDYLEVPECYKELVQQKKSRRVPRYIALLNEKAGSLVCDNERIFIRDKNNLSEYEGMAILATHTGNTSVYSFAAEVECHARFLIPWLKIRIPFSRRSIYESAIRADMSVDVSRMEDMAPFYRETSKIVKRQYHLHKNFLKKEKTYD